MWEGDSRRGCSTRTWQEHFSAAAGESAAVCTARRKRRARRTCMACMACMAAVRACVGVSGDADGRVKVGCCGVCAWQCHQPPTVCNTPNTKLARARETPQRMSEPAKAQGDDDRVKFELAALYFKDREWRWW